MKIIMCKSHPYFVVNYQRLKHVGLQLGVGMSDIQVPLEPATIGWLTFGVRIPVGNSLCIRHCSPEKVQTSRTLLLLRLTAMDTTPPSELSHAVPDRLVQEYISSKDIRMSQFLPSLKRMGFLATGS